MKPSNQILTDYMDIGTKKCTMPIIKCFVSAIMAGAFIALAGLGATVASCTVSNSSVAKLISGGVFPAGLAMVVLVGSELFTGNCLCILPVVEKRVSVLKLIKTLIVVYVGNLVGSMLVVLCAVYGHTLSMFDNAVAENLVSVATAKTNITFVDGFLRGIMCNVLVCIAVWMAMSAKSAGGKVIALYLPILVFVVCGFEHSVANMFYIPAGILAKAEYGIASDSLTWFGFFVTNEVPVTLGNIIGGFVVALSSLISFRNK